MTDTKDDDMDLEALTLLAEALPAVEPPPSARARLHEELTGRERFAPFAQEISDTFEAPLPKVLSALARIEDDTAWLGSPSPGLRILHVHGRTVISRLPAGTQIAHHKHTTRELTYVLDGVLVSDGVAHGRAACLDMAPGTEHALHVADGDECLVVFCSALQS